MNLYTPEYLREWHRRGTFCHRYINDRRNDLYSGFGDVPVLPLLYERAQDGLPELNEDLVEWLGDRDGVDRNFEGWHDRAVKLMHDWSAEFYSLHLLATAAQLSGAPVSISYSPADDFAGVDCRVSFYGHECFVQLVRRIGAEDNSDDRRKHLRRLLRGEAERDEILHWRPPFDELDQTCQPFVPLLSHAELFITDLNHDGDAAANGSQPVNGSEPGIPESRPDGRQDQGCVEQIALFEQQRVFRGIGEVDGW